MITARGRVKLLDFGLALRVADAHAGEALNGAVGDLEGADSGTPTR